MSQVYRGTGDIIEFPGVVSTDVTAGALLFLSGSTGQTLQPLTSVELTAISESSSGFFGVSVDTISGGVTGVRVYRRGVFEFNTLAASTSCSVIIGRPVWGAGVTTVRGGGAGTASTITGKHPIGICVGLPNGPDTSAASVRCWVDIDVSRSIPFTLGESGNAII